jgi:hypothetical protein
MTNILSLTALSADTGNATATKATHSAAEASSTPFIFRFRFINKLLTANETKKDHQIPRFWLLHTPTGKVNIRAMIRED